MRTPSHTLKLTPLIALVVAIQSCDPMTGTDSIPPSSPTGLATRTGDNFIELFWDESPESDLEGYHVYLSSSSGGPFVLIGSGSASYFVDTGARNGQTYFYTVSAYDHSGNESELSREIVYDIPRPEGYGVILHDFRNLPDLGGYDFSTFRVLPYDDLYTDMYYEYYQGEYYMVVRLEDTDIQDMGATSSILDVPVAPASGWSETHDVRLTVGHTYVVWTWDDHYAKFRVTSISPGRIVFDWAYQLQKANPLLKRIVGEEGRVAPHLERSR